MPGLLEAYGIPGAGIALVVDGEVVWTGAYGLADVERGLPMTPQIVFRGESLSKPVTAWGVLKLVEEGRVELDQPVERYLGGFTLPRGKFSSEGVTVRRLLGNTAGLPLGTLGVEFPPGAPMPSLEEALAREARPLLPPGAVFHYSNPGFNLLELLVERVTGRPFERYMEEEILRPLGMEEAEYGWSGRLEGRVAMGYDLEGTPVPFYVYPENGSGGLLLTVDDAARFIVAGVDGGRSPSMGGGVLPPASLRLLRIPVVERLGIYSLVAHGYGLGHLVETLPTGQTAVFHGGQGHGWMTHLHMVPATGDGLVILTNSQRSWPFIAGLVEDWAVWRGFGGVGMERITRGVAVLRFIVGLLLLAALVQGVRLLAGVASRRRGFSPLQGEGRVLRGVQFAVFLLVVGLVGWAMSLDYFFLSSVFPRWTPRLGMASLLLAGVLLASALFPRLERGAPKEVGGGGRGAGTRRAQSLLLLFVLPGAGACGARATAADLPAPAAVESTPTERVLLPFLFHTPETRLGGGVVPSLYRRLKPDLPESSLVTAATLTARRQYTRGLRFRLTDGGAPGSAWTTPWDAGEAASTSPWGRRSEEGVFPDGGRRVPQPHIPDQQPGGGDPDLEPGGAVHPDVRGRSVLCVHQERQQRVLPHQVEEVRGFVRLQGMDRAGTGAFVVDVLVAPREAVQLVLGVEPQDVGHRVPLEDMGVHQELVPGNGQRDLTSIGKLHVGLEGSWTGGDRGDCGSHLLQRESPVALGGGTQRRRQGGHRQEKQAGTGAPHGAHPPSAPEGMDPEPQQCEGSGTQPQGQVQQDSGHHLASETWGY